jgi:hypothetical protein
LPLHEAPGHRAELITEPPLLIVNTGGSLLPAGRVWRAFFNTLSYLAASFSLWRITGLSQPRNQPERQFSARQLLADLRDGLAYLGGQPQLLYPLLLTFATMTAVSPTFGLLAAVVHNQGGSIVGLGLLSAGGSAGALLGAAVAGMRRDSEQPARQYAFFALVAATALAAFALLPVGYLTPLPLAVIGFIMFYEAVGNTSRIRLLAAPLYQARLQALATMVFWIGAQLWWGQIVGVPAW